MLNVDGKKKTDIHRTCSLYTWGHLQSRQFQRHQGHHRLLLSLLLRASMISRLDESRSQKRSQIRIFCGLEVVCPAGLKHPRNRFPIASQGTTLPRLPLTNFMLPSIWVMVFPRPKAFKSNSCSALRVMFCSLKTSSSLSMMRHACDMPATCQQCCITPTKKDLTQSEKSDLGYIRLKKKYKSIGLYTETTWQIDKQDLVCGVNDHVSRFFVIVCRATKRVDRPLHTSCLPAWLSEGQRNFLPSQHQTLLLQPPFPWQSMTQEKVATTQHRHAYCTHHISSNSLIPSLCMDSSASKFYYFAFNVFDNLT